MGVLLNISADHLDRHGPGDDAAAAMTNYAAIKERLVASAEAVAIGVEDAHTRAILERLEDAGARLCPFTTGKGASTSAGFAGKGFICSGSAAWSWSAWPWDSIFRSKMTSLLAVIQAMSSST